MKSASENASELKGELTLEYNKFRQASITSELLEPEAQPCLDNNNKLEPTTKILKENMAATTTTNPTGTVTQIIGPVVDVQFLRRCRPSILHYTLSARAENLFTSRSNSSFRIPKSAVLLWT